VMAVVGLHERVRPQQVAGAVLVVGGLVVSRLAPRRDVVRSGRPV